MCSKFFVPTACPKHVTCCERPRFGPRLNESYRIGVAIDRILPQPDEIAIQMDYSSCGDVGTMTSLVGR